MLAMLSCLWSCCGGNRAALHYYLTAGQARVKAKMSGWEPVAMQAKVSPG